MKSEWLFVGLTSTALATSACATSAWAQVMDFNKIEIITEQLGPNVYMLSGSAVLILPTTTRPAAGSVCSRDQTVS